MGAVTFKKFSVVDAKSADVEAIINAMDDGDQHRIFAVGPQICIVEYTL